MARKQRAYELIFGKPIVVANDFFSPLAAESGRLLELETYYDKNSPNAYLITEHDMSFSVIKSSKGSKNRCEITVKNLSPETIEYVTSNRDSSLYVEFNVGYVGEIKNLFKGSLKDAFAVDNGIDTSLKLTVVDGLANAKANTVRVYPKNTQFSKIVHDLRLDLALPVGRVVEVPSDKITATPLSLFGNSYDKLKAITNLFDYDFTINDGNCYIVPKKESLPITESAAYISSDTGLIGSVQNLIVQGNPTSNTGLNQNKDRHIRFSCQMDASIKPLLSVYVDDPSTKTKGVFKVEKTKFKCSDFNTGSYTVTVDCIFNDKLVLS